MKTLATTLQMAKALTVKIDQSILSRFLIGRRIAGLFKNKTHRNIFLTLWFGKTVLFYWIVL